MVLSASMEGAEVVLIGKHVIVIRTPSRERRALDNGAHLEYQLPPSEAIEPNLFAPSRLYILVVPNKNRLVLRTTNLVESEAVANDRKAKASPVEIDFGTFPSTRYQGSKRKILPWIHEQINPLDFSSVLDLFGGTGAVSYLFKKMGKKVVHNDILKFNHLSGLALIENDTVILTDSEIEFLTRGTSGEAHGGFIERTFGGFYYTDYENHALDVISSRIKTISKKKDGKIKAAIASHALFQACLVKRPFNLFHRKNLYLRLANVERSFGNKTTWDAPLRTHFLSFLTEANASVFKGERTCRAVNSEASAIKRKCDLVYIDPPYLSQGTNETADYKRCYHFLEGMSRYDEWESLVDKDTKNFRMAADTNNWWINEKRIFKAFDALFEKFSESILAISYKQFGTPSISTLDRMLKRHGRKVRIHTRHYCYALNHQNGDAKLNREVILIAE